MEKINIIFSSDNNYAQYLGVTLCSIFENKTCSNYIYIYVLESGINDDNKRKLSLLENKYNFKINYIKMNTKFFKDFHISRHVTQAVYYRIMIAKLLLNINKVLYLDCDIILNRDVLELYKINTDDYFFVAVEEPVDNIKEYLEMPKDSKYFNSGVMLINLKKWRENNISEKVINFIKTTDKKLNAWDQDALNYILSNKWLEVSYIYNYTTLLSTKYTPLSLDKIWAIHYTGLKPWNYMCDHIHRKEYFHYLNKTPWKNNRYIDKNFKKVLKRFIRIIILCIYPNIRK